VAQRIFGILQQLKDKMGPIIILFLKQSPPDPGESFAVLF